MHDKDYALVIGINDYPDFRSLRGASRDASAFADWLRDAEQGGALPPGNVESILSSSSPPAPLQPQIDRALESLLDRAATTGGRRFYFYFSGHGCTSDMAREVALCLVHWSKNRRNAALSSARYEDALVQLGVFPELVFFLDCCRIWQARAVPKGPDVGTSVPSFSASGARSFVAYATSFNKVALETEADPTTRGTREVHGIFTEVLLAGLRGAAADERGFVTASSLKRYLEHETPRRAKKLGFEQHAEVLDGLPSNPETVFVQTRTTPSTAKVRIEFGPTRTGEIELQGARYETLRRGDAASGPWEIDLPLGLYRLIEKGTAHRSVFEHEDAGEVTRVVF